MSDKCSRCGKKSAIELNYGEGELCRGCFSHLFEKRVKRNIRKNNLLAGDDDLLVFLDGGFRSLVCLSILNGIVKNNPRTSISAFSIDEGIEGFSAGKNMISDAYCKLLGVDHNIISFSSHFGFSFNQFIKENKEVVDPMDVLTSLRNRLIRESGFKRDYSKIVFGKSLDMEVRDGFSAFSSGRIENIGLSSGEVSDDSDFLPSIKPLRDSMDFEILKFAEIVGIDFFKGDDPFTKSGLSLDIEFVIDDLEDKHPGSKYQMLRSIDKMVEYSGVNPDNSGFVCPKCGVAFFEGGCKTCSIVDS